VTYQLIALDLDGTLLLPDQQISARVKRSIRLTMEKGIVVTLASARAFAAMRVYVEELGIRAPLITTQGCRIVLPDTQQIVYDARIPLPSAQVILNYAQSRGLDIMVLADERLYLRPGPLVEQIAPYLFDRDYRVVDDLADGVRQEPTKFVIIDEGPRLDQFAVDLEREFGSLVRFVRSSPRSLEGIPLGVSKGTALERVAQSLGVPRRQVMAIGDSDNDVEMLVWAGLGVAMGNATERVKAVADYVAPGVDQDGVALAIERFCLDQRGEL